MGVVESITSEVVESKKQFGESTAVSTPTKSDVQSNVSQSAGGLIRRWRAARRMSQMDLALESRISPRHLSFVETGRSNPSRATLSSVSIALDLSLREHNSLMMAGGYSPTYPSTPWTAPELQIVQRSLSEMVRAHAPFPAMVVDFRGDILLANDTLLELVGDVADKQKPLNAYRLVLGQDGIADRIVNRDVWHSHMADRVIERAAETGDPALLATAESVTARPHTGRSDERSMSSPVLPLLLEYDGDVLTLTSIRAYLTEPRDVTASELCLETFIPLDDCTRTALAKIAHLG